MKKFTLTLLLAITLFLPVFSQNGGFIGKRFIFNVNAGLTPSFRKPTFLGSDSWFAFNYILNPGIEYIVGNKVTVGAHFTYYNTKMDYERINDYGYSNKLNYDIDVLGSGIFCKLYLKNETPAPLGSYFRFQFDWLNFKLKYNTEGLDTYKKNTFGLKIEYGSDFIVARIVKLNVGVFLGVTTSGWKGLGFPFNFDLDNRSISIEEAAATRILNSYCFGVNLGIGILAF